MQTIHLRKKKSCPYAMAPEDSFSSGVMVVFACWKYGASVVLALLAAFSWFCQAAEENPTASARTEREVPLATFANECLLRCPASAEVRRLLGERYRLSLEFCDDKYLCVREVEETEAHRVTHNIYYLTPDGRVLKYDKAAEEGTEYLLLAQTKQRCPVPFGRLTVYDSSYLIAPPGTTGSAAPPAFQQSKLPEISYEQMALGYAWDCLQKNPETIRLRDVLKDQYCLILEEYDRKFIRVWEVETHPDHVVTCNRYRIAPDGKVFMYNVLAGDGDEEYPLACDTKLLPGFTMAQEGSGSITSKSLPQAGAGSDGAATTIKSTGRGGRRVQETDDAGD